MKFEASFKSIGGLQQISVEARHIAHALYEISRKGYWINWVHQMVDTIAVSAVQYSPDGEDEPGYVEYIFSDGSSLWYNQSTSNYEF